MRIALAQINPTIGDVAGNAALVHAGIERAGQEGADLVVFPELALTGYPPKDLLLKEDLVAQCAQTVTELAEACRGISAVVGYPAANESRAGRPLYNAAAVCGEGRILHRHFKHLLPTYDVFDETRYFEPGPSTDVFAFQGLRLGLSICEDLWNDEQLFDRQLYHRDPIRDLAEAGAEVFVNCSASPFTVGKHEFRRELFESAARRYGIPVVYVNQVGGNDELVFDGNSCVIGADGALLAQARDFAEDLLVVDLPPAGGARARVEQPQRGVAAVFQALVMGLRDYCGKCGFDSVVLGLSGGIDSAVTAALAVAALGPRNVTGIAMPSRYSSPGSVTDARELAENLGIDCHEISIGPSHQSMEQTLEPLFAGTEAGVAEENIQARLRGMILMAASNKFGSLVVSTGNKSELAVGYCTLYGDMAGGLALLSDVPKMMVYELAEWINDSPSPLHRSGRDGPIPLSSITKPPSAELRPDQTDQDSLPPYEILDQIIEGYVEQHQSAEQIASEGAFDLEVVLRVVRMIDRNEYKRKQAAPGIKITGRAFGFGRRMPIAQRYRHGAATGPRP
ncbi:MAG: NAD+ synthase [Phycisphaerae bacterium]|nr:NAD+ synthase [Phycisphaerae bacterium]